MPDKTVLEQKNYDLDTLYNLSRIFSSSLDLFQILDQLLLSAMGKLKIFRSAAALKREDGSFRVIRTKGLRDKGILGHTFSCASGKDETAYLLKLPKESPLKIFSGYRLILSIPISNADETIGFVFYGSKHSGKEFTPEELNFLESVTNLAANALKNAVSYEKIKSLNETLDKKLFRLNTLLDLSRRFNSVFDEMEIAKLLGFVLMGELLISRFFIFFKNADRWRLLNKKGTREEALDAILSALNPDNLDHPILRDDIPELAAPMKEAGIEKIHPVRYQNETRCIFGLGPSLRKDSSVHEKDDEFLETLGNYTINALENAFFFHKEIRRKRIEEEMEMARQIQKQLLPESLPKLNDYEIFAQNISSYQVGGDLYDVIKLDENNFLFGIADVTGKGTPASLLMSNLQAALRTVSESGMDLPKAVFKINNLICKNTSSDKFITFFVGILNLKEHTFRYVNAGHNPPVWYQTREGKTALLEEGGLLLGVFPNAEYDMGEIIINEGDHIFMFTDGINEALDEDKNEFGDERLTEFVASYHELPPDKFVEKLFAELSAHRGKAPQSDDITLIDIRRCR
jgi:sigma-B regulation protein RsbU (phosphoserine phosphatase)